MEAWSSHGCAWRLGVAWMCMEAYGTYCIQVKHGKEQRKKIDPWQYISCVFLHFYVFFSSMLLVYYISEGLKALLEPHWR